ncbi:non-ribosomal peptide synthetase [Streptomyces sp. NBC_00151]|uniref:non-ribosomal peptide synthetase n=1 Tax=Streptomyces sp. NBC_00151 TaxID=2975669 RepID=UPI002DD9AA9C|nr:amino acid adenylation domain-containing protein [Streptomyces sp. NBC_00151]WRZ40342.1 amino acid adenylation domain-containing protein [Streptomyces sp. NBC_00151]
MTTARPTTTADAAAPVNPTGPVGPAGPVGPGDSVRSVNAQQAGLWFIHETDPGCSAYHIVFGAEVTADAELGFRARNIIDDLTREHDALRTGFRSGPQGPEQFVRDTVPLDIRLTDVRGTDPEELRDLVRTDSRTPFDLSRPPLWRVHLYRTGEHTWVFTLVMHHIAADFWSLALLLSEVRGRLEGTPGPFALDGGAFAAYADRQQSFLTGEKARALRDGEEKRLGDAPPGLDLYGDRPRPPAPSYDGGSAPFALSAATTEAVRRLARETSATPYTVLLSAYFVLLSRLSGQSDILVGTPTSGRLHRRFRDALGNFVNTVVVRGEVDEESTYRELLTASRERVLEAMRAQELPFPWLVRELAPPRDPSRTPLYQAGFAWDRLPFLHDMDAFFLLEPGPGAELDIAGATLRPYPLPQQEGQTDLWIEMGAEKDGAFAGVLRHNTDIFGAGTARELAATFVTTVETLVARPDEPLRALVRGDEQQRARLAAWGTGPERAIPAARLPELFRDQVARTPGATALTADDEEWSYARLLDAVEQTAAALRTAGIAPGDRVAVMAERGAMLVASLLAVLDVGAAYVPLDPKLPAERLAYMAEDSRARLLISRSDLRDSRLPGLPVLELDDLAAGVRSTGADKEVEAPTAGPSDLAYILYTSGSTGRPKGVAIPHHALTNLLLAMRDDTGFTASDSLLAVTTISFDIAGLELYMPLVAGGRVIVCDSATAADGAALAARIDDSGATWMQATPTSWRMLRDAGWKGCARLNVLCGGEELPLDLAEFLAGRVASLRNVYGPTETTVWSTAGRVDPSSGIDIGAPLANTRLHVLDPQGRDVEPGVPGELWIGGDGLALGYWDRPELTAERFVTGLPAAPDWRLYRTGDRARWTSDGRLLHHGRLDNQVKLRGYRIELSEVEAVLGAVDGVSTAVVVVRDDRLVAYLVAEPGTELRTADVKSAAAVSLPPYMVPGIVMVLDELPLTANKKIDRNRLPEPVVSSGAGFEQPRDATEIVLARMWTEILGISQVGIHDNFFDVGGHSLLAVRLSAAVRAEWDVEIPISDMLRQGTIAELAAIVRSGGQGTSRTPVVTLREGTAGRRPVFLFHPFGGTVFCYVELTHHLPPGRPVLAVEAPGIQNEGEAEISVEAMATRYIEYLREIQPAGPYALGGWCFGGVIGYEVACQLRAEGEEIEFLIGIDSRAPVEDNIPESADDSTILSWFARDLAVPAGKTLDIPADDLRALGGDAAFDHILQRAAAIGVLAEDADRAQILRYFEAYLANGIALQTYLPEPAEVDLVLLRAADEPAEYGPRLGWEALIKGSLNVMDVPGDHNSVMYPPHAETAARAIAPHMEGPTDNGSD